MIQKTMIQRRDDIFINWFFCPFFMSKLYIFQEESKQLICQLGFSFMMEVWIKNDSSGMSIIVPSENQSFSSSVHVCSQLLWGGYFVHHFRDISSCHLRNSTTFRWIHIKFLRTGFRPSTISLFDQREKNFENFRYDQLTEVQWMDVWRYFKKSPSLMIFAWRATS